MAIGTEKFDLLTLASDIVSAHVSNSKVESGELPRLIREVYGTLADLGGMDVRANDGSPMTMREPAVPFKKSVRPEAIICLECGTELKMLKRHLTTHHGLSVEDYRAKWNLPADYPIVAPNYAKKRSALAKAIGLGTERTGSPGAKKAASNNNKRGRGRPRKDAA